MIRYFCPSGIPTERFAQMDGDAGLEAPFVRHDVLHPCFLDLQTNPMAMRHGAVLSTVPDAITKITTHKLRLLIPLLHAQPRRIPKLIIPDIQPLIIINPHHTPPRLPHNGVLRVVPNREEQPRRAGDDGRVRLVHRVGEYEAGVAVGGGARGRDVDEGAVFGAAEVFGDEAAGDHGVADLPGEGDGEGGGADEADAFPDGVGGEAYGGFVWFGFFLH